MRDPNRIPEVICALASYWMKNPDLRLSQIVSNASNTYRARKGLSANNDVFHFEDDDLLSVLHEENQ